MVEVDNLKTRIIKKQREKDTAATWKKILNKLPAGHCFSFERPIHSWKINVVQNNEHVHLHQIKQEI